jgi:hypothetical protein
MAAQAIMEASKLFVDSFLQEMESHSAVREKMNEPQRGQKNRPA